MARILMLHGSSDLYGASKIFLNSIAALQKSGHQVTVVLSEDGPLAKELLALGVDLHLQKLGILRRKYFNLPGLFNRIKTIWKAKIFLDRLIFEKEITHLYSNTSAVLVGAFAAKKGRIRHIWHLHEILVGPKWFADLLGNVINKYADVVIVVSQAVWDNWKSKVSESKMLLLYNGIDYSPYLLQSKDIRNEIPKAKDKILIGMIGRINHWKGQPYFLDMVKVLVEEHQDIHFLIVGDAFPGTEHFVTEMLKKIEILGLQQHVTYLGYREDIPAILKSLDIFVLPSILPDPLPTVILEAMASAKPVVATHHGGACEMIIQNETGFLIPWDNAEVGAQCIGKLIIDKNKREEMGVKGKERVLKKFSPEAYQTEFIKLFEDVKN